MVKQVTKVIESFSIEVYSAAISFRPYINELEDYGALTWLSGIDYETIRDSFAYHHVCIYGSVVEEKQGFITNEGLFILPSEALEIAAMQFFRQRKYSISDIAKIKRRGYLLPQDLL